MYCTKGLKRSICMTDTSDSSPSLQPANRLSAHMYSGFPRGRALRTWAQNDNYVNPHKDDNDGGCHEECLSSPRPPANR